MPNDPITPAELDKLEAACDAATGKEWKVGWHDRGHGRGDYGVIDEAEQLIAKIVTGLHVDADFIALARTAMPRLIARVRESTNTRQMARLRKELATAKRMLERIPDWERLGADIANTPDGYRPVTAYTDGNEIVVLGNPPDDNDDGTLHDCDLMGCSSVSHVIARVTLPTKQESPVRNPGVPTRQEAYKILKARSEKFISGEINDDP